METDVDTDSLDEVAETPEERVDRSLTVVFRVPVDRQEQRLPGGVHQRVIEAVLGKLDPADQGKDRDEPADQRRERQHAISERNDDWMNQERAAHAHRLVDARNQEQLDKETDQRHPEVEVAVE